AVDGRAGRFAEFAGDFATFGCREGNAVGDTGRGLNARWRVALAPAEQRGEPAEEEQRGGAGAGRVADGEAAQGADAGGAIGRVIHLRDGLAEVAGADPVQVAEDGAAGGE